MARAGVFTITEIRRLGGKLVNDFRGERFAWSADRRSNDLVSTGLANEIKVAAHAIPFRPWTFGGKLRTVRTDYAATDVPSEQVMGANHVPFTVNGRWSDKYNFAGFAEAEMRRFEKMCFRGNIVRIAFQRQSFDCLITEWEFNYERKWDISYSFTVSVHNRSDRAKQDDRAGNTSLGADEHFNRADVVRESLESVNKEAPVALMSSPDASLVGAQLDTMKNTLEIIDAMIEQRQTAPTVMPVDTFQRLATKYTVLIGDAVVTANLLRTARSDNDLGAKTALGVLSFETWTRGTRSTARTMMAVAQQAAQEMAERSQSNAQELYRPFRGESLYHVSEEVYGTPHAWRLIADRNRLPNFILDGTELLIIPERGVS